MRKDKNDSFDVAVVGVGVGANYGSVLTYYSLYQTIKDFDKSVLMVSKIGANESDPEIQDTHAMKFAKKHYNLSKVYSQETVPELNKLADTFVIGSDQVWNYGISQNFGKAFYLDFVEDSKRKVSYASSFGHAKDFSPVAEVPKITSLMKRFNAISVREDSGVKIARDIYCVPATQVAEPIFLLDTQRYMELGNTSERDVSEPYLLAYILDPTPEKKAAIEFVAKEKGLKIRIILDAWPHLFEQNKAKMDIKGAVEGDIDTYSFLKLYANASYVLTDSFHGTAFALKFEKPFASIGNKRRGVARFNSIFALTGHRERFTLDANDIIKRKSDFLAPLDYTSITKALDMHVQDSKKWLGIAINKPVHDTIANAKSTSLHPPLFSKIKYPKIGKGLDLLKGTLKYYISRQKFQLSPPVFESNSSVWQVENKNDVSIFNASETSRGNIVWANFPTALQKDAAFEMTLNWKVRTAAEFINVHLRNPTTGKFRVVGTVAVNKKTGVTRTDKISFHVSSDGFSQVMFGAVHFSGVNAGADVKEIFLKSIPTKSVVPNSASATGSTRKRSAAAVVKEYSKNDSDRFIKFYAQHRISKNIENSRSLLMFYSHGFEKGLSRSDNFRAGFGKDYMLPLAEEMNKWIKQDRDTQAPFFKIAASVMKSYFDRHQKLDFDVSHFWKLFSPKVQEEIRNADKNYGGVWPAHLEREAEINDVPSRNFVDVVFARRSIREFTPAAVDNALVERAVVIAIQAPSVCNRQPARVHQFDNPDAIKAALELQGGFRGYKMPSKLLLVTSDLSAYVGAVERNQAFIDGGLFMMLLLLGIEQVGLGSCCLNTAMSTERENAIRGILDIPENEIFISFIAIGHFMPEVLTPQSKRIPVDDFLIEHGQSA